MKFDYDKIDDYYDHVYWNTPGEKSGYVNMVGSLGCQWHKDACSWFNSVIPVHDKTLFDAGCGLGHFMLAFRDLGAKVYGCDVSNYCAPIVRHNFGHNFFHTSLEKLTYVPENFFDIVFTSATFEHLPCSSINQVLQNLSNICKPGGLIYIEVDTKPNKERDLPEDSHICIQPWDSWLKVFGVASFPFKPEYILTHKLRESTEFPGFPLPDWNFFVFSKPLE